MAVIGAEQRSVYRGKKIASLLVRTPTDVRAESVFRLSEDKFFQGYFCELGFLFVDVSSCEQMVKLFIFCFKKVFFMVKVLLFELQTIGCDGRSGNLGVVFLGEAKFRYIIIVVRDGRTSSQQTRNCVFVMIVRTNFLFNGEVKFAESQSAKRQVSRLPRDVKNPVDSMVLCEHCKCFVL